MLSCVRVTTYSASAQVLPHVHQQTLTMCKMQPGAWAPSSLAWQVFSRSVLAANEAVHVAVPEQTRAATERPKPHPRP